MCMKIYMYSVCIRHEIKTRPPARTSTGGFFPKEQKRIEQFDLWQQREHEGPDVQVRPEDVRLIDNACMYNLINSLQNSDCCFKVVIRSDLI